MEHASVSTALVWFVSFSMAVFAATGDTPSTTGTCVMTHNNWVGLPLNPVLSGGEAPFHGIVVALHRFVHVSKAKTLSHPQIYPLQWFFDTSSSLNCSCLSSDPEALLAQG